VKSYIKGMKFAAHNNREGDNNFALNRKMNPRKARRGHKITQTSALKQRGTRLFCVEHGIQLVTKSDNGFTVTLECGCTRPAAL
jgi:hypothetical protein